MGGDRGGVVAAVAVAPARSTRRPSAPTMLPLPAAHRENADVANGASKIRVDYDGRGGGGGGDQGARVRLQATDLLATTRMCLRLCPSLTEALRNMLRPPGTSSLLLLRNARPSPLPPTLDIGQPTRR